MGSCISKCRPKKKFKRDCNCMEEDFSHVQEKLVISQPPLPIQNPVSPSPSVTSSTSFSSVSCANSSTSSGFSNASSLSSSSSCSSSIPVSKDRSFSNEFLWSCVKENPQIIGRNLVKGNLEKSSMNMSSKVHPCKFDLPIKQAIPERHGGSTPKKRARANSPTLIRQKSFRKEPEHKVSSSPTYQLPSRTLMMRSPSPSRRFTGDSFRDSPMNTAKEIYSRRAAVPKANSINPIPTSSSIMRKDSFRIPPSPSYDLGKSNTILKSREALITQQIGSRNSPIAVGQKEANQDVESMVVEDVNNPLIALDCFIFL
ncbi:uncharacterized protein [Coffea arabica]|uniref:Uncharacterized protein n=1 Tax=Coffea arabica TaxID=13443 RepID=A0ABM4W208_COFAR